MTRVQKVGALIGNPRAGGRTTQVAEAVATEVARRTGAMLQPTVELADLGPAVLDWADPRVDEARASIAALDLLIVATPVFKATYTGLLKGFLDRYPSNGLTGVTAVPVMVGGAPEHALATEVHLRPLLVELGAATPARGLFVLDSALDRLAQTVQEWGEGSADVWRRTRGGDG